MSKQQKTYKAIRVIPKHLSRYIVKQKYNLYTPISPISGRNGMTPLHPGGHTAGYPPL
jgi:hypothetical protein